MSIPSARPSHRRLLIALAIGAAALGGCASQPGQHQLDAFDDVPPEIASIPDAVPKVEPRSRYGNPKSYEVFGKRYYTKASSRGHVERGLASWYGKDFHGRRTSSGEPYDMHAMTAAHKTLPLPTYARVTNLENGRSVVVRINDRGPFHGSRVIDLSYTAATKLGMARKGTAMVEVRAIDPRRPDADPGPMLASSEAAAPRREQDGPTRAPARAEPRPQPSTTTASTTTTTASGGALYVQVGAFGDPRNAERLRSRLRPELGDPILVENSRSADNALYRVRIGPLASHTEASALTERLAGLGIAETRLVQN
ncbi:septal ring lytic transglycosylase RlpA family protein [Marichromatium gracile]|uniref:septal ring lytic transglycosylase RlpA family protein n=1 Tax=Marichromatium gracile TaxID=1048 RepID=UPI001F212531|nr:septal ring lytic transglycosylase RlpA family protein [Marichromatium gracile]MCF1182370.1 septal ring lytic transglycosylase RlpA family protein [Marichromatium gracile]